MIAGAGCDIRPAPLAFQMAEEWTVKHRSLSAALCFGVVLAAATVACPAAAQTKRLPSDVGAAGTSKMPVIHPDGIALGAYDPHGDFSNVEKATIEHLFLPWLDVDLSSLLEADAYASSRGRKILVTVEPWSWSENWSMSPQDLRDRILSGGYDDNIDAVCGMIARLRAPVTIRWAHEMDDTSGQFPWSQWTPERYVKAYQKFVTRCRSSVARAEYMWSPIGNENLAEYYPGNDYVDVVGLSVFGLQQYDNDKFGRDRSFADILKPKYEAAKIFSKPIVVAELGYEGNTEYVENWANAVALKNPDFPELAAVVYFNDREVYPWPENYGLPNWRVAREAAE